MFGYDGPQVNSNLKNTLVTMMNYFDKPDKAPIFIVNDKVYPYPKSYDDLIKAPTLFEYKVGNAGFTDFARIFQSITDELKEGEMAILASDLIYSDPAMTGQAAGRIQDAARNRMQLAMRNYAKYGSLLILKLRSEYKGRYYPYNSPNKGLPYQGNRPYYIMLFARNATMIRLLHERQYTDFRQFGNYAEFENSVFFSSEGSTNSPFYTLLETDTDAKGQFDKDRKGDNANGLHAIKDVKPPRQKNQKLTLVVAAALPTGGYGADFLQNPANYEVTSPKDDFKIKAIKPIQRNDGTTHKLILEANRLAQGDRLLTIRLRRTFPPAWVQGTTTADDTQPNKTTSFAQTTFGLQPMLMGIQQAYDLHTTDRAYQFTINLSLKE
ncbi:hypothetical protein GCM10028808_39700 [Spirosoma migulaei]